MPIANCFVTSNCHATDLDLISAWSSESGVTATHMTINIIHVQKQFGCQYPVMATLQLPSLWAAPDVSRLQIGLANALAQYYGFDSSQVHVVTTIVGSGHVVDDGQEVSW